MRLRKIKTPGLHGLLWVGWACSLAFANSAGAQQPGVATVRGRVVVPAEFADHVAPQALNLELVEKVELPDPPLPQEWLSMDSQQRLEWWNRFAESAEGKAFRDQTNALIDAARVIKIRTESDGQFALFDVAAGPWRLEGMVDVTVDQRDYMVYVEAEFMVAEGVEEIVLGDIPCTLLRIIKQGSVAPNWELKSLTGESITPASFAGRHLLICFCDASTPDALAFTRQVVQAAAETRNKHRLDVLVVGVAENQSALETLVQEVAGQPVHCVHVDSMDHPLLAEFGVQALTTLFLIDGQGKVAQTDESIFMALHQGELTLAEILRRSIAGEPLPGVGH